MLRVGLEILLHLQTAFGVCRHTAILPVSQRARRSCLQDKAETALGGGGLLGFEGHGFVVSQPMEAR